MPGGQGQCGFDTDCPISFHLASAYNLLRMAKLVTTAM
jgi:hypothetical protein